MGTVPAWPTFASLEYLTSTKMTALRNAGTFWSKVPRCFAYRSGALNVTNWVSTWTLIGLDAEVQDIPNNYDGGGDAAQHDNVTNNSRIVVRTSGIYEVIGAIEYAINATGFRSAMIRKNAGGSDTGGTMLSTTTQGAVNGAITSVPLPPVEDSFTAGDYIELFGRQSSGGTLAVGTGSAQTLMRMKLTGAP